MAHKSLTRCRRRPEHRVTGLIPFVHVDDVERSIAKYRETPVWALQSGGAELMVTRDGDPIDPAGRRSIGSLARYARAAARALIETDDAE